MSGKSPVSAIKEGAYLLLTDIVGLLFCFSVIHWLRIGEWMDLATLNFVGIMLTTLLVLYIVDVYHSEPQDSGLALAFRSLAGVVIAGALLGAMIYMVKPWEENAIFWRSVLPVALVAFAFWAVSARIVISKLAKRRSTRMRWLVLGSGDHAKCLMRDFSGDSKRGSLFFLQQQNSDNTPPEGMNVLGSIDDVQRHMEEPWTGAVVATGKPLKGAVIAALMNKRLAGLRIYDLTDFYEKYLYKVPILNLQDGWFALSHGFDLLHHNIELRIKRIMDMAIAAVLIGVLFPIMVVIGLIVVLDSRGGVFYSQRRTGLNGKEFYVLKFRTMVKDAEKQGKKWAEENDPRITRVGRILRAMRIDELPQLWNVLVGEMGFVGPRPERPDFNKELEKKIPYYDLRHLVKPGITGWAQVLYPYGSSVEDAREKLQYDLYYIKNYSLMLDAMIALKTIRVVLFGRGR